MSENSVKYISGEGEAATPTTTTTTRTMEGARAGVKVGEFVRVERE